MNDIARNYALLGLYEEAEMALAEAEKHVEPSGQLDQRAYSCLTAGSIEAARGDFEASDKSLLRGLELYTYLGRDDLVADTKRSIAENHSARGAHIMAQELFTEAENILIRSENPFRLAAAKVGQGLSFVAQGALGAAENALAQAEARLESHRYFNTDVRLQLARAELLLAQSKQGEAHDLFSDSIESSVRRGFKDLEAWARIGIGRALVALGRLEAAGMALESARDIAVRLGLRPVEAAASLYLSEVRLSEGDRVRSPSEAARAIQLAERMSLAPVLFLAYVALGRAHSALGRSDDAASAFIKSGGIYELLLANVVPVYRAGFQIYTGGPMRLLPNTGL